MEDRADTVPGFVMQSELFYLKFITGLQCGVSSKLLEYETDWYEVMEILLSRLQDEPESKDRFELIASRDLEYWARVQPGGEQLNLKIQVTLEEKRYFLPPAGSRKTLRLIFNDRFSTQVIFHARKKSLMMSLTQLAAVGVADHFRKEEDIPKLTTDLPATLIPLVKKSFLNTWTPRYFRTKMSGCPPWCICKKSWNSQHIRGHDGGRQHSNPLIKRYGPGDPIPGRHPGAPPLEYELAQKKKKESSQKKSAVPKVSKNVCRCILPNAKSKRKAQLFCDNCPIAKCPKACCQGDLLLESVATGEGKVNKSVGKLKKPQPRLKEAGQFQPPQPRSKDGKFLPRPKETGQFQQPRGPAQQPRSKGTDKSASAKAKNPKTEVKPSASCKTKGKSISKKVGKQDSKQLVNLSQLRKKDNQIKKMKEQVKLMKETLKSLLSAEESPVKVKSSRHNRRSARLGKEKDLVIFSDSNKTKAKEMKPPQRSNSANGKKYFDTSKTSKRSRKSQNEVPKSKRARRSL